MYNKGHGTLSIWKDREGKVGGGGKWGRGGEVGGGGEGGGGRGREGVAETLQPC